MKVKPGEVLVFSGGMLTDDPQAFVYLCLDGEQVLIVGNAVSPQTVGMVLDTDEFSPRYLTWRSGS